MKNGHILKAALVLALALVLTLGLPFAAQAANATSTHYVDEKGARHDVTATILDSTMTNLAAGVYVVEGTTAFTGEIYLSGDVTLILADGCD